MNVLPIVRLSLPLWVILAAGCANQRMDRNLTAGQNLALLFRMNENMDSGPRYPDSLEQLEKQLTSAGIQAELPRCKCADGQFRDFVYIPGFDSSDIGRWVFLVSPPEMDTKKAIVVHVNTTAQLVSKKRADEEVQMSREFVHGREEKDERGK